MRALASLLVAATALSSPATIHQQSSYNEGSSVAAVGATFGLLDVLGPAASALTGLWKSLPEGYPLAFGDDISTPALLSREPREGYERWTVASPAMGRTVGLDVIPGSGGPTVYLLEGVDSPETSNWITKGYLFPVFSGEDATVVIPAQGAGSMWQDWESDDPVLGRNKWETFLTQELPPLVEAAVSHNGKRAIIGLSMGASGAVMLANKHPGFYAGVAGISGCYSTMDQLGRGTVNLTVTNKGGSTTNMWGEFGSPAWRENDVVSHPEGLRGSAVYLYSANGAIDQAGLDNYTGRSLIDQIGGSLLEAGSQQCTRNLSAALDAAGIAHTTVYGSAGAHDWYAFGKQLSPAWAAIKPAVQ